MGEAKRRKDAPAGNFLIFLGNWGMLLTAPIWGGCVLAWIFWMMLFGRESEYDSTKAAEFRRGARSLWNG